jgi:hypothetical protein
MLIRSDLLRIASDNSTAWFVRGDVAEIIGDGNAFVYEDGTNAANRPYQTLRSGDHYDLATRSISRRR